jgi:5-(carboxyamino)imidazole ribonucleotide synthase
MKKIAILGAGQLALMTLPHLHRLGVLTVTVDQAEGPAHHLSHEQVYGHLLQIETYEKLLAIENLTHVTLDIENVLVKGLRLLESKGLHVYPSSKTIETIQNKGLQRKLFADLGLPGPLWLMIDEEKLRNEGQDYRDFIVKLPEGGYDGKGVWDMGQGALPEIFKGQLLLEKKVHIKKELAILAARNHKGEVRFYDPVEMIFDSELHLMNTLFAPARISSQDLLLLESMAKKILLALDYKGLLAVEFFLDQDDKITVNEIAPRAHNSGHHTQVACPTDQFEQHCRGVLGLPLGSTSLLKQAMTFNVLGQTDTKKIEIKLDRLLQEDDLFFQWYGKKESRPGRKMAHITLTCDRDLESDQAVDLMNERKKRIEEWFKI